MNLDELKNVSRTALITEIKERTKSMGFVWKQITYSQYRCTNLPYDFYLTKTTQNNYALDVMKNGKLYRSYNSYTQPEVEELYTTVDLLLANSQTFERMRNAISAISRIRGCAPETYNETMIGNILGSGAGGVSVINPHDVLLLPNTLDFGPTLFPWSGDVLQIADIPDVTAHDSDLTYIRQQISGALPTQWGYATAGFLVNTIGDTGPYSFNVRVVHRREAEDGVEMIVDVLVNESVVFSDTVTSEMTYQTYESGTQSIPLPDGEAITTLQVRVSMFTNTGNTLPRALLITAMDIKIFGYDTV